MQTTRFTRLLGITLAVMLTLVVRQGPVFGHDDDRGAQASRIEGVWDGRRRFSAGVQPEIPCESFPT
jgi:hypothetical protein